jgi:type II secretory pathway component PulK
MKRTPPAYQSRSRRGAVLIAVIFVTVAIAGMALVLCRGVRVEAMASANHVAMTQAAAIERGAEQYVLAMLAQQADSWMDLSESYFYAVPMADGYFWLIRPDYGDASLPLFGLIDEGSKVNLNSATPEMLIALPNMPPELTFSVVDWRDADSNIQDDGAENEYYMALAEPYYCKNAPFETVEEVLLVRGAYPQLLYGTAPEAALNVGRNTAFGSSLSGAAATDYWVARGLYDLLTVHSRQPGTQTTTTDGGAGGGGGGNANSTTINITTNQGRNRLRARLEGSLSAQRINEIAQAANGADDIFEFYFNAKMTAEEAALLGDDIATTQNPPRQGRINLNTAPREVLMCLPNMDQSKADQIVSARQSNVDRTSLVWVVEALGQQAAGLGEGDRVTARSYQYTADILAVSADGRAFKRCRVIVDTTGTLPKIVHRRDLTERGWPLDRSILESIRTGNGVPGSAQGFTTGARL